jgi:hypothetical protein
MTTSARRGVATIAAVLAAILLPLSILATWVDGVVSNENTYVATVGPLVHDPVVRAALVDELDRQVRSTLTTDIPGGADSLLGRQISRAVRVAVGATVRSDAFAAAWRRLNRAAHRQILGVLRGDRGSVDSRGRVRLSLDPLLRAVLGPIENALPSGIVMAGRTHLTFTLTTRSRLHQAQVGYRVLHRVGPFLPFAWVASLLVALLVAPDRRRIWTVLGVGTLLGLVVLRLLLVIERHRVVDRVATPSRGLAGVVWDHVLHDPLHDIRLGLIAAVLVLVARFVYGTVVPRRTPA